jgi:hypothetical protein
MKVIVQTRYEGGGGEKDNDDDDDDEEEEEVNYVFETWLVSGEGVVDL